ncbi:cupin domain-containing protein [Lentzea sp. BCCO 10_0061]|uniref:Cupin domain-containing protein n=1 Tax=Lentzea sokolovensis TaxID=3095429 RepID=A0ABU4V4W1_9PSEU|nr:cupin domain-containing protein [Lentzea sp. BCCO 10_0061]MDX8146769.1 cupin domain-containing protein [Lentzea sp. BCCO 10_0061]
MTPEQLISALNMQELPVEGGYFAQTHRSEEVSAIAYLLRRPDFSGMHVLKHLEIYHFHAGSPLRMLLLHPDGTVTELVLSESNPQVVVPAGVWQGSTPAGDWSLVGTVVVPPYTDNIVEFGHADDLCARYPSHAAVIRPLCRF